MLAPSVTYYDDDEKLAIEELLELARFRIASAVNDDSEDSFVPVRTPDTQPSPARTPDVQPGPVPEVAPIHSTATPAPQPPAQEDATIPAPSLQPATQTQSTVQSTQTKKRLHDDNVICIDLDDDDIIIDLTQPKKRVRVSKVEPDEDNEDEVCVSFYKKGNVGCLKSKTMMKVFQKAFEKNSIRTIVSPGQVSNRIGTLFCVYDDRESPKDAQAELLQNQQLMKLCMEGRLRMTPLSRLLNVLDSYDYDDFNLDTLKDCSYPSRRKIEKFASRIDPYPLVPANWRIPLSSISMYHRNSGFIIDSRNQLQKYLHEQMFPKSQN